MSATDDAMSDLPDLYPALARPDIERVVALLAGAPAADSGMSIAAALKPLVPAIAERLTSMPAGDITEYLRVLRGAATVTLAQWPEADGDGPNPDEVYAAVRGLEDQG